MSLRFFPSDDVDEEEGVIAGNGGNGGSGISVNGGGGGGDVNFPLPVVEVEDDEPGNGRSCCDRWICLVGVDVDVAAAEAIDVLEDEGGGPTGGSPVAARRAPCTVLPDCHEVLDVVDVGESNMPAAPAIDPLLWLVLAAESSWARDDGADTFRCCWLLGPANADGWSGAARRVPVGRWNTWSQASKEKEQGGRRKVAGWLSASLPASHVGCQVLACEIPACSVALT